MKMKMKNRLIDTTWYRHGLKYGKYKPCRSMIMLTYIKGERK